MNFKKQNTILISHLEIILKLTNLMNIFLILSFICIGKDILTGASITTVCFTANGSAGVFICLMMVTIFVSYYNPQITKARVMNLHKSNITLNSGLCM